jgi:hypothetical protein
MSKKISNNANGSLCSGYKIFPNGSRCAGCIDCDFGKSKKSIQRVFDESHALLRVSTKKRR